jgi:hypothetical protein
MGQLKILCFNRTRVSYAERERSFFVYSHSHSLFWTAGQWMISFRRSAFLIDVEHPSCLIRLVVHAKPI